MKFSAVIPRSEAVESLFTSMAALERFLAAPGMTTQDSFAWSNRGLASTVPDRFLPFQTPYARSRFNNFSFLDNPHLYPARFPSARTTRWHGTTIETGFVAHARATARTARGFPTARAIWVYVLVAPRGIFCSSCHTRR